MATVNGFRGDKALCPSCGRERSCASVYPGPAAAAQWGHSSRIMCRECMIACGYMTSHEDEVYIAIRGEGRRGRARIDLYREQIAAADALAARGILVREKQGDNVRRGQPEYVIYKVA